MIDNNIYLICILDLFIFRMMMGFLVFRECLIILSDCRGFLLISSSKEGMGLG